MAAATPYEAPSIPIYAGRCLGGADNAIMVKAPEEIPAPPTPVIARPIQSARLFGATPKRKSHNSSVLTEETNTSRVSTYRKSNFQPQRERWTTRRMSSAESTCMLSPTRPESSPKL